MTEAKAGKRAASGLAKSKSSTAKRRGNGGQAQTKKPPSKSTLKKIAKDWDQVT